MKSWAKRSLRSLPLLAFAVSVCLAQSADPSAKVVIQSGQVSAMTASGLKALFPGDVVKPQQIIMTGADGYAQLQVSDGSTFEVFPNSRVSFREHAGSLSDLLNVWLGRVKVYIQHLNGVPNYNKVSSPTAIISVRGTVFEVAVEDDDGTTFVKVDEGLVDVRNQTAAGDPISLRPGDSIRVFKNQPLAARKIDRGVGNVIIRAAQQALYDIVLRPRTSGGITPGGGTTSGGGATGTANGDTGKGGSGGTTTPPGAPSTPEAPSSPGAP
jgi:hypothetical protein